MSAQHPQVHPRVMEATHPVIGARPVAHETHAMLRVLHVLDSLQIGGTEWQCLSLIRDLDRNRYGNVFVCFNAAGPLLEILRAAGVPSQPLPFRGFRRPAGLRDLFRLAAFMRRQRIDIVQAYGFYSNVPAILAGRIAGVPILLASRRDMGEFLTRAQRLIEKAIFHLADRVVVNATAIKEDLLKLRQARQEKIAVIPTGVDLHRFDRPMRESSGNDAPPWAGKGKVVAMVATFREQKDHPGFLRAAKRILEIDPTVVFVLGGGRFAGSAICEHLEKEAKRLTRELGIASSVWFLGAVDPREIPSLLRHVDISVLVSRGNEGIPNTILEAMAAGKPVVTTDSGGCREAVEHNVTGFLVPPGDVDQLAERIHCLLCNSQKAIQMGEAGRERVETEFSLTRMRDRFSALYEDLAHEILAPATRAE
jgi:glycosyltransferase involved in cell wall biosynthesis